MLNEASSASTRTTAREVRPMFSAKDSIDIARAPEVVFDFLADIRAEVDWNPLITSAELLTPEPIGEGSQFRVTRKGSGQSDIQITGFDRPSRLVYKGTFRGGT